MKYFVSADIHGFYDEWITALKEEGFDIKTLNIKLLFVVICLIEADNQKRLLILSLQIKINLFLSVVITKT